MESMTFMKFYNNSLTCLNLMSSTERAISNDEDLVKEQKRVVVIKHKI